MTFKKFGFLILPTVLLAMSSCLGDDNEDDYTEWRQENAEYIIKTEASSEFQKIVPKWDKASYVLMNWHRHGNNPNKLKPLDNSTIDVVYLLTNIKGDTIDSSYRQTAYGDSIFRCRPSEMITGFWIATTSMNVGDSVTAVIPYMSGYGISGSGSVLPYSTLIFNIRLDSIVAYESRPL